MISCKRRDSADAGPAYYNNIGCVYFKLQRFNASTLYFEKAAASCDEVTGDSQQLPQSYSLDVAYNRGLSLLAADLPVEAFKFFSISQSRFSCRPHLWARMAECCVRRHSLLRETQNSNLTNFASASWGPSRAVVIIKCALLLIEYFFPHNVSKQF
jgi:hypothetical protein